MPELNDIVASKVRFLRKNKNLSQSALAELADVHEKTIISVESGKHSVSLEVLEKISNALKINAYELLRPASSEITKDDKEAINEQINIMTSSLSKLSILIND